jgi:hypothetical protein
MINLSAGKKPFQYKTIPITINLECGLVGQSRMLYRTCEKKGFEYIKFLYLYLKHVTLKL